MWFVFKKNVKRIEPLIKKKKLSVKRRFWCLCLGRINDTIFDIHRSSFFEMKQNKHFFSLPSVPHLVSRYSLLFIISNFTFLFCICPEWLEFQWSHFYLESFYLNLLSSCPIDSKMQQHENHLHSAILTSTLFIFHCDIRPSSIFELSTTSLPIPPFPFEVWWIIWNTSCFVSKPGVLNIISS